jgi:hypothetical protein
LASHSPNFLDATSIFSRSAQKARLVNHPAAAPATARHGWRLIASRIAARLCAVQTASSAGDVGDGAAADAQLTGDGPLRKLILIQQLADFQH